MPSTRPYNKIPFSVPMQRILHKSSLSSSSVSGMGHAPVWLPEDVGLMQKRGSWREGQERAGAFLLLVQFGMEWVLTVQAWEAGIQRNRGRCQSLVLWGTRSGGLAWSSVAAPKSQGLPLPGHQALPSCLPLFCEMWADARPSPSLPEAASASSPSLSSIRIFLYLLQRSEKQINEKKDPIILRPGLGMGGGARGRSIK